MTKIKHNKKSCTPTSIREMLFKKSVLLQGIFQTQGSNPGLLHCSQILYCLSHQGSPLLSRGTPLTLPYLSNISWFPSSKP